MNESAEKREEKRQDALRALDRVQAESETIGTSSFARMADRAQKHLSAADKDEEDPIEVWGTRIGRAAGVIFAIGLVIYLFVTYF
ncbi:conserved hypothetical protein [Roseibium sp. TrichSKD4]|uniref:hypothetical protein n=1 Tax=Roseibium sp. TrichSKD4 TaxID=744980 RepID=UPI0001E56BA3|nr:hypothetical protein [Roseibium sp. TrichSKD4]EFO32641.1 conserved hypothetical protein [Roseibium sp. TrichSKD4]